MRALQSRLPPKDRLSQEWREALQLLACSPRGAIEEVLVVSHEISRETLAILARAGLAMVVIETLRVEGGGTFTIDRLRITDAGRRAIGD
jgi:hypothetical protein